MTGLENWQSEFLQLFSFTILAAVFIHKGSTESKDSDDRIEAASILSQIRAGDRTFRDESSWLWGAGKITLGTFTRGRKAFFMPPIKPRPARLPG